MDRANYVYRKIAVGPSDMLISPGIHAVTGAHASLYYSDFEKYLESVESL
jgi:hypothetical protein